jgi:hypothetical protein
MIIIIVVIIFSELHLPNLGLQTNKVYKSGQDDNYTDSLNRTREYFGPVDIQRLSVQILDEYGRILDLNNMDWSFILSFVCLYD